MEISEEKVDRYIKLYLQKHGERIERSKARDELTALVCLLEAIYQHLNKTKAT